MSLDECFRDKAVENELKTAVVKCINQDCPWEGLGKYYKVCRVTLSPQCCSYVVIIIAIAYSR